MTLFHVRLTNDSEHYLVAHDIWDVERRFGRDCVLEVTDLGVPYE